MAVAVETPHPALDQELAYRLIRARVTKPSRDGGPPLKNLFTSYPEYDIDSIVAEGVFSVVRQWHQYKPSLGAQSTFIIQRSYTAIIDLQRRAKAGKSKLKRFLGRATSAEMEHHDAEIDEPETEQPLAEWLSKVQAKAKTEFRGPLYRRGRRFYKVYQLVAIASLKDRFGMGSGRCAKVLGEREDLRLVLGLRRVPTSRHIRGAMGALRQFRLKRIANEETRQTSPDVFPGETD